MNTLLSMTALNAMPLPVLIVDNQSRIALQNVPMTQILGADLVGVHHITALRQPSVLDAIAAAQTRRTPQTARYLGREGARDTTFAVTVTPADEGMIVVFEDLSAATQMGQQRRDFVANVSHELRTPLTALLGFIETLQGPARDDSAARDRFLGIMAQEADRMRRLVDDLLSLSRVEEDERVRPRTLVNLVELVPSVVAGLDPLGQAAGTPLICDVPDGTLSIPADAAQLRQVLNNLIENAIKYGRSEKGVRISVSGPRPEPMLQSVGVRLIVQDFGDGIDSHHLTRLTERFYRVDSHRSREVGGTGLGLAIAKHIINRHRGRLLIQSVRHQGTIFTVLLPANLPDVTNQS